MRSYSLIAPAKVNLYLEIVGARADGYHELVMVLRSIDLADRVELRSISVDTIRVRCDNPEVPADQTNLAYRAAELMVQQFPDCFTKFGGIEIDIQKRIPMGAGLAGGSANAASVLVGLDLMWHLGLTQMELQELGATLGSDVPFCLAGGTALATGRGEQLDVLPSLDQLYVVLAKYRSLAVSTAWAYQTYRKEFGPTYPANLDDPQVRKQRIHSSPMLAAIAHQQGAQIGQLLYNDLEKVVLPAYPAVQHLRETFQTLGCLGTMMSGSGSTVFALVETADEAERLKHQMGQAIPDPDLELWVSKFSSTGIRLL